MAKDVKAGKVKTVEGSEVTSTIADGKVKVNDANVVKILPPTVIHVNIAVLMPMQIRDSCGSDL